MVVSEERSPKQYLRCVFTAGTNNERPSCKSEPVGCASAIETPALAIQKTGSSSSGGGGPGRKPPPPPSPAMSPPAGQKVDAIGAAMSSKFHAALYPASAAIDGDVRSLCATAKQANAWVSVQVPRGTAVRTVVIFNRPDNPEYQAWLSPFEVWVGAFYGDAASSTSVRCGAPSMRVPATAGPFSVTCAGANGGGARAGPFVTVKQTGGAARFLTLGEVKVYAARDALHDRAPSPPRPPPPRPLPLPTRVQGVAFSSPARAKAPAPTTTRSPSALPCIHIGGEARADDESHGGTQHRLDAPQVSSHSCSALVLSLPPLPPDHCDDDSEQRLAIESKYGSERWSEIKHNVLSAKVVLGGLLATRAYEFRTVLHRPQLGNRFSGSSGLVVVEDSMSTNVTITTAPHIERLGGAVLVSWESSCRGELPFTVQAASVPGAGREAPVRPDSSSLSWHTIVADAVDGKVRLTVEQLSLACQIWCVFRLEPAGVDGWAEPTLASQPVNISDGTTSGWFSSWMVFFLTAMAAYAAVQEPRLRELAFWREKWAAASALPWKAHGNTLRDAVQQAAADLMANASWLSRAWLDGLGAYRPAASNDVDDGDKMQDKTFDSDSDLEMDEFAPLPGRGNDEAQSANDPPS